MENYLIIALAGAAAALVFAYSKASWVSRQDPGDATMNIIAGHIRDGAMAFLKREYQVLVIFVIVVAALLGWMNARQEGSSSLVALSFAFGAFCSGLSGYFGMKVATQANVRTTQAAKTGLPKALVVAFSGGTVMGMSVVGLGLAGLALLFLLYTKVFNFGTGDEFQMSRLLSVISGFSLGASSIALFARVGGGIYTKAADVGADLVGKTEAGIPEDDPRNPAVIADNVGDNVGDVAGMGADLFESYVGAIVGAMVLGVFYGINLIMLPLVLAALGIIVSILGTFAVRMKDDGDSFGSSIGSKSQDKDAIKYKEGDSFVSSIGSKSQDKDAIKYKEGDPQRALNLGTFGAGGLAILLMYPVIKWLVPQSIGFSSNPTGTLTALTAGGIFGAVVVGLVAGVAIGLLTEHYTSESRHPVRNIAKHSLTGPATTIIGGLSLGMMSTALPVTCLSIAIVAAYKLAGLYGIAIAALGMLCTTGIQLAVDAYGPIADNAGGIAQMSRQGPEVRERTDKLDAVGNTTAAIGKGFAIGSAALTALALFSAFQAEAGIKSIDISRPEVIAGLFMGAMLPFLFSSMALKAVGAAAFDMVAEVRRQFKEIPGLLEGKEGVEADYAKCVDISTAAAIKKMVLPGLLAVVSPVIFGLWNIEALGGLLAGVTVSGVLLAIFMSNSGGAWDNAKKHIEGGAHGGKGSSAHMAAVVGDTVGDPFKDTAGPSLNILIKLMSVVALVIAPFLKSLGK